MLDIKKTSAVAEEAVRDGILKACSDFNRGLIASGELACRINKAGRIKSALVFYL